MEENKVEKKIEDFNLEPELERFAKLEKDIDETLLMISEIISMFNAKTELAKGSAGKITLLVEQKISLMSRKESVIKNIADLKKTVFNTNTKLRMNEEGGNSFEKAFAEYTEVLKRQEQSIREIKNNTMNIIGNSKEVEEFFSS